MVSEIDELIKYLIRVFNGIELTLESEEEKKKYGDYTKKDEILKFSIKHFQQTYYRIKYFIWL